MTNPSQIFDRYKIPDAACNCGICLRSRWHQDIDGRSDVPEEVKVVLRWYWDCVENLEAWQDWQIDKQFQLLHDQWLKETAGSSNITQIANNWAYQEIVKMGTKALPFIFGDLMRGPQHWFVALHSITGVDPVKAEHRGRMKKMAEDWLEWGKNHGYVATRD